MTALNNRLAALEAAADTAAAIGRVVMIMGGPLDASERSIMARFGIPARDDDFYIRVRALEPDPAGPMRPEVPCSIAIRGKWLVVGDERTEVAL